MLDNLHVRLGPKPFGELPHVYDIPVKDNFLWLDRFEITEKFFRPTTIGTQMYI
jgi:hypothetical protein